MKKWTSLLLALAMALSLAACGNSGTQENTSEPPRRLSVNCPRARSDHRLSV